MARRSVPTPTAPREHDERRMGEAVDGRGGLVDDRVLPRSGPTAYRGLRVTGDEAPPLWAPGRRRHGNPAPRRSSLLGACSITLRILGVTVPILAGEATNGLQAVDPVRKQLPMPTEP
jgi:hypothetical protein